MTGAAPSLREERRLLREGHARVVALDEVGRGALAGPVSVGAVLVDLETRSAPVGVRDSKLLTPAVREELAPRLRRWAPAWAVGHAQPEEIDRLGIIAALRLAGWRAIGALGVQLHEPEDCVLIDGSHDWLSDQPTLFAADDGSELTRPAVPNRVVTRIKADLTCSAVAAASVLAKVERDSIMVQRSADHPQYGWAENKGYAAPEHVAALRRYGPCVQHRRSWRLPGVD